MNTDIDLTSRLDALGRSLAPSLPMEPPGVFLAGVKHAHRVTLVKKASLCVAALAAVIAIVMVASRRQAPSMDGRGRPEAPHKPELPAVGAMRSLVSDPDDIDDAPLMPARVGEEEEEALPPRVKEWRKELLGSP